MTQQVQSFLSAAATTAYNAGATVCNTAKAYPKTALAVAAGASLVAAYAINPSLFALTVQGAPVDGTPVEVINHKSHRFFEETITTTTPTVNVTTTPTLLGKLFGYVEETKTEELVEQASTKNHYIFNLQATKATLQGAAEAFHADKFGKTAEVVGTFGGTATAVNYITQAAANKIPYALSKNHSLGIGRTVAGITGTVAAYVANNFIGLDINELINLVRR